MALSFEPSDHIPVATSIQTSSASVFDIQCYSEPQCGGLELGPQLNDITVQQCCNGTVGGVSYSSATTSNIQRCFSCTVPTNSPLSDTKCSNDDDIRLVFRDHSGRAGLLQVCSRGVWHYLCNLNIGYERTACLQLGFGENLAAGARISPATNPTPEDLPPIFMGEYFCLDNASSLANCQRMRMDGNFCSSELVHLSCPGMQ